MYWDVVEVKPEQDYRLFVRFKDGLAGRVQLRREELTGALAPLLDVQFFEQVFVDYGAVAWPGEIDLAPDAMYAQIANQRHGPQPMEEARDGAMLRRKLPRIYELKDLTDSSHPDAYFRNFEDFLQAPTCLKTFVLLERELQGLDPDAWEFLSRKASPYLTRKDAKGRGWQQLFDFLDAEASAYNYLKESVGCSRVSFIPESGGPTPDFEGVLDDGRVLCEVKTINNSDDEVRARREEAVRDVNARLESGFLGKLDADITNAKRQLQSYDPEGNAQHLVYIKICFDDWARYYEEEYLRQIDQYLLNHPPRVKVVVSAGLSREAHAVAQQ
jgi:hypothetical protein